MYYRYKVKKKDRKILPRVIILLVVSAAGYYGYQYRQYLQFWKFSYNKLNSRIEHAAATDKKQTRRELLQLVTHFEEYKRDNPVKPEAFLMAGKVFCLLAETGMPGTFSERLINGTTRDMGSESEKYFLSAVINLKKGKALLRDDNPDAEYTLLLAKALYFLKYCSNDDIAGVLKGVKVKKLKNRIEDIRFFALMQILSGEEKAGFDTLQHHGAILDSTQGRLFLASVEVVAKRYTNAIMNFKDALGRSRDDRLRKLIHVNLGKIYYNQSLYKESLGHFTVALKLDVKDTSSRIWIGKNYHALGQKDRARAIWSEALTIDRSNVEIRRLLGVM